MHAERPKWLYRRILNHIVLQDNLLQTGSKVKHNGMDVTENKLMGPTVQCLGRTTVKFEQSLRDRSLCIEVCQPNSKTSNCSKKRKSNPEKYSTAQTMYCIPEIHLLPKITNSIILRYTP